MASVPPNIFGRVLSINCIWIARGISIAGLEALITVEDDQDRTPLTWVREWAEAPTHNNLAGIVERLQTIQNLVVGAD